MAEALVTFTLSLFAVLPFFEGCESAAGLLIAHTLILASLVFCLLKSPRIWFPPLAWFLPFLCYLVFSALMAPYKYSSLLTLWDWWIAFFLAITWTTLMKENEDLLGRLVYHALIVGTAALILSLFLEDHTRAARWSGTFADPNNFGTYAALLFLLGIFKLEKAVTFTEKAIVWVSLASLAICISLASSRSVFLACAAVMVLYLVQRKPARWVMLTISGFIVTSGLLLTRRLMQYQDPFQYYRLRIWKYSLQGILKDPYFGIGLNMLPWKAAQFNFPGDSEVGRYGMIATSADNQYLQILAETGFVGFFLFLMGWIAVFSLLMRIPKHFTVLRYGSFLLLSIIGVFALPFQNTAIFGLFLFCLIFPIAGSEIKLPSYNFSKISRGAAVIFLAALFAVAVFIPFLADHEFRSASTASTPTEAATHLRRSIMLNPIQPYYRFSQVKPLIVAKPALTEEQWQMALDSLQQCINLNPLEANFYVSRAHIYRILLSSTGKKEYFNKALENYQQAEQQSPFQVFQQMDLAYFLFTMGVYDLAEKELRNILELEPVFLNARLLLVDVLVKKGDIPAAREQFQLLEGYEKKYAALIARPYSPYLARLLELNTARKQDLAGMIR